MAVPHQRTETARAASRIRLYHSGNEEQLDCPLSAGLDHLTHRAHIVVITGASFRAHVLQ